MSGLMGDLAVGCLERKCTSLLDIGFSSVYLILEVSIVYYNWMRANSSDIVIPCPSNNCNWTLFR